MARLVEIGVRFNQHIADVDDELVVAEDDLEGCPTSTAPGLARNDDGRYRITMAYPDVVPFLENARRRDPSPGAAPGCSTTGPPTPTARCWPRRWRCASGSPSCSASPSWAHHTMDEKMAHDPETVDGFYEDLVPALTKKASGRDRRDGRAAGRRHWRRRPAVVGPALLRHPAAHDRVRRRQPGGRRVLPARAGRSTGCSTITGEVFGVAYERLHDEPVWHPDVRTYAIVDPATGARSPCCTWTCTREGKFSHAAAFTLVPGRRLPDGSYQHTGVGDRRQLHQAEADARRCCRTSRWSPSSTSSATSSTRP